MKILYLVLGLVLFLVPATRLPAKKTFASPQGLTLTTSGGELILLWEPILREDLMGYSVWLRKPGEHDFTRLKIPTKIGGQVRKMPVTDRAKLRLKGLKADKKIEFTVVAEYEDQVSDRSKSVYTHRASNPDLEKPAFVSDKGRLPDEKKEDIQAGIETTPQPFEDRPIDDRQTLLVAPGDWELQLGLGFEHDRIKEKGKDALQDLGFIGAPSPLDLVTPYEWKASFSRNSIVVPLEFKYGLSTGLEVGAIVRYRYEDQSFDRMTAAGVGFETRRVAFVNGGFIGLPGLKTSGLGNTTLKLSSQMVDDLPFLIKAQVNIATGKSRLENYLLSQYIFRGNMRDELGNDEGATRVKVGGQYGWRGIRKGPYVFASYSPGGVERFTVDTTDSYSPSWSWMGKVPYQVRHSNILELGVGYTLPVTLSRQKGAMMVGAKINSISKVQYVEGVWPNGDPKDSTELDKADLHSGSGTDPDGDQQLELFLELDQGTNFKVKGNGRLYTVFRSNGLILGIQGQFSY